MTSPPDLSQIRRRMRNRLVGTAVPSAVVVTYVLAITLGLSREEAFRALLWQLGPLLFVLSLIQRVAVSRLFDRATAELPGDAPGARLARLLEFPRRVEVTVHTVVWLVGSLVFGVVACAAYGRSFSLVPVATLVGFLAALFPGLILGLLLERQLLPLVLQEQHRTGLSSPRGRGIFWPRLRWYLPYAFAVAISSLLGLGAVLLTARWGETTRHLAARLDAEGLGHVTGPVLHELDQLLDTAALEVGGLAVVLLAGFVVIGLLLARREARASDAVEAALQSLARGAPAAPEWASTDELGDLARSTALVNREMERIFAQLRAVAGGDLSQEWQGESGLVVAFRESQAAMLQLARLMVSLSKGEIAGEARIPGELGQHVDQLLVAFRAMVDRAQDIARGDLRSDVEVPGALGQAIRRMTDNLRAMVGQTQGVSGEIDDLVVNLQAASSQLSAATTEQVAAATETANTMTEMAQTSAVSAERASQLIDRGETAAQAAEDGGKAGDAAAAAMAAITSSLTRVSTASTALAERTRQIDGITDTVGFLADQSSTLAINAAIEASRAGESGRGFAIVAREIRQLAADSRQAAKQIQSVLSEIRGSTDEVDAAVAAGSTTLATGTRCVEQLSELVGSLGTTVHEAVGLMRQVEGSARQHEAGVTQVSRALTSMQRASESIRDGAALLGELSAKAEVLAEDLQKASGAYVLPPEAQRAPSSAASVA